MKTTIYYFSGSGNSFQTARELATRLGKTKLLSISSLVAKGKELNHRDERIGLVFPTYYWGVPRIVTNFVDLLRAGPETPIFSIVTCGSSIGKTNHQLDAQLRGLGMRLQAGFRLVMPGNYTPLYGGPKPAACQKTLAKTKARLDEIVEVIQANQPTPLSRADLTGLMLGKFLYPGFIKRLDQVDQKFQVNESCDSCGICVQACPVKNIILGKDGRPSWQGECEQCLACLHWCPKEAIDLGKKTRGRRRYRHPEVKLKEMRRSS